MYKQINKKLVRRTGLKMGKTATDVQLLSEKV